MKKKRQILKKEPLLIIHSLIDNWIYQRDQQTISQELAEVVADFQGIYDTSNKIKGDLFYTLSRESA